MYRKAESFLKNWYHQTDRRPLVLRGARQVGKSTLVRNFCRRHNLRLIEINLEKLKLKALDSEHIDIVSLITEIEDIHQIDLAKSPAIIFFDEIQAHPRCFQYLRYFFEDYPLYAVIAAGSLLEFYLSEALTTVPVGRLSYFFLGPMDFEEFLYARGKKLLLKRMKFPQEISEFQHEELLRLLKEYLFIGGMPSAVKTYLKTKNWQQVRLRHTEILQTYRDDFLKYSKNRQVNILSKVFNFVPFHLGQKVKYSEIAPELRSEQVKNAIDLLIKARVVLPVYHTNASGVPLSTFEDQNIYKLYFLDVGLVLATQEVNWRQMDQKFLELNQRGSVIEQFIAQHLYFREKGLQVPSLNYWLKDKTAGKAEIDFLFQKGLDVFPVEVKTGSTGSLKSLWQFIKEKKSIRAIQFYSGRFSVDQSQYRDSTEESPLQSQLYRIPHYLICKTLNLLIG